MVMRGMLRSIGFAFAAVLVSLPMLGCGLLAHNPSVTEPPEVTTAPSTQQPPEAAPQAPQQSETPRAPAQGARAKPRGVGGESTVPAQPDTAAASTPQPPDARQQAGAVTPRTTQPAAPPSRAKPAAPPQAAAPSAGAAEAARKSVPSSARTAAPVAPLDVKTLKQELKDTKAIGIFSKLTLKNQMDDLLGAVRKFHQGQGKLT